MGFDYFNGDSWIDITREERFFCSEVYHHFKNKEKELIKLIAKLCNLRDKEFMISEEEVNSDWEIGYEVCFYRDYAKHIVIDNSYSQKRTFDLCLFSESRIIVIEAKSHEGFNNKEMNIYKSDIKYIKESLNKKEDENFKVNLIALCSSNYMENCKNSTRNNFDLMMTWNNLYECTNNIVFKKADSIYKK